MTKFKQTKQKILGAWYTPNDLIKEMLDMVPEDWWKNGIFLEPTAGNGNIVLAILNKLIETGIDPQISITRIIANEIEPTEAQECTNRVQEWCKQHNLNTNWKCLNEDARTYKFNSYDYVITNLPFGFFGNHGVPKVILNNVIKEKKGVIMTKNQLRIKHCVRYKTYKFPNITHKVKVSLIDCDCNNTDNEMWADKYKDLFDTDCKWNDVNGDIKLSKIIWGGKNKQLIEIIRKKQTRWLVKFSFTQEELNKLENIKYTDREIEYFNELKDNTFSIPVPVIFHIVNRVLKESKHNE